MKQHRNLTTWTIKESVVTSRTGFLYQMCIKKAEENYLNSVPSLMPSTRANRHNAGISFTIINFILALA